MKTPFCLLLTGEPNSGKSTIAYALVQKRLRNCLIIDGDKHREMQFLGKSLGFSRDDIMENNKHVFKLAKFAQDQGFNVIIPQIMPYKEQRYYMRKNLQNCYEVYLHCPKNEREKRVNFRDSDLKYEISWPDCEIPTHQWDVETCLDEILYCLETEGN